MRWTVRPIEGRCRFTGVFSSEKWTYIAFFPCVVLRSSSILISEKDMCSSTLVHFPEENRPSSNYGYHAIIETTYGVPTVRCTCSIFIILKSFKPYLGEEFCRKHGHVYDPLHLERLSWETVGGLAFSRERRTSRRQVVQHDAALFYKNLSSPWLNKNFIVSSSILKRIGIFHGKWS